MGAEAATGGNGRVREPAGEDTEPAPGTIPIAARESFAGSPQGDGFRSEIAPQQAPVLVAAVTGPGLAHLASRPLRGLDAAPLTAFLASPIALPEPGCAEAEEVAEARGRVVALDRALLALAGTTTVIPVRYGAVFSNDAAVREELAGRSDAWEALLARADGAREYRIELREPPPAADGPTAVSAPGTEPGRAFLERRRAERDLRRGACERFAETCGVVERIVASHGWAHAWRPRKPEGPAVLALLARPDEIGAFSRALAADPGASDTERMAMTGPWPLYSFVGAEFEHG